MEENRLLNDERVPENDDDFEKLILKTPNDFLSLHASLAKV